MLLLGLQNKTEVGKTKKTTDLDEIESIPESIPRKYPTLEILSLSGVLKLLEPIPSSSGL